MSSPRSLHPCQVPPFLTITYIVHFNLLSTVANDGDDSRQLDEYRRQLDYYKKELEKAMQGKGESMETKIEINSLKRELETKNIRLDDLEIQVNITRLD